VFSFYAAIFMTIANLEDQELAIEVKGKGFPEVCSLFVFVQKKKL